MAMRRFGIVDAEGVCLNVIAHDDAKGAPQWPGYGVALVDMGEEPAEAERPKPAERPAEFPILAIKVDARLGAGDRIDLKSGVVTKAEAAVEEESGVDAS